MEMWSYNRLILKTGQSSLQVDVYSKKRFMLYTRDSSQWYFIECISGMPKLFSEKAENDYR